jgi:dTDP-4-amino-4,6-dideoxygalactose transaminase
LSSIKSIEEWIDDIEILIAFDKYGEDAMSFKILVICYEESVLYEEQKYLEENNIGVGIHYPISISNLKCYENYFDKKYENAEKNSKTILSLPMYPDLTDIEIKRVCELIINFYSS